MRIRINCERPSTSATSLARAMGVLRLSRDNSRFRPRADDVVVNWGTSRRQYPECRVLNRPEAVALACDKIQTFLCLSLNDVPTVPFYTLRSQAQESLDRGNTVLCRTTTRGRGGEGIVIVAPEEGAEVIAAPLYTDYCKKADEYRVFVVDGVVVRTTQKRRRRGDEVVVDSKIRSAANGYVFCQEDVNPPENVLAASRDAVDALCLDFGAVDIGYNRHYGRCDVYEVNTAFGLEGTTLEVISDAIRGMCNGT